MRDTAVLGVRMRGTLGDIDPLNKVLFKRSISRVKKGAFGVVSLILPRMFWVGLEIDFHRLTHVGA